MFPRSILFAALATTCVAQSDPLTSIAQALSSNGLTGFASLLPVINQSSIGQGLFRTLLSGGNFSLFVPNNEAISQVPSDITNNSDTLANIVSYHILQGNFTDSSGSVISLTLPNVTIGRTLLNDSSLVQLEGNRSQVLLWGKESNGEVRILNQPRDTIVRNVTRISGLGIYTIDQVLTIPPTFSQALTSGLSTDGLVALLNNTPIADTGGSNLSYTSYFDSSAVKGFTLFAPNNAALLAAQSTLSSLQANVTAVQVVLGNHVVNGSTLYSTTLANTTSASGEPLTFFSNSSGTFVSSGNVATARITATNVLAKNGVIHVIDRVLANTQSNPAAASSAHNQATSGASQTVTETGPLSAPTSTATGGSNGRTNGALLTLNRNIVWSTFVTIGTIACAALLM